ncbi:MULTISPECIES: monovalent cation/H+ antiporter complex subunit F [unclassified Wenzhouxiangella]|uniref:monovalent cation/H+ antiporter complex subunit F n=1 Tax=unclassified Wenzhouxiangella TaxID=2613841 RepID=UPI000E3289EB|nr:MULTISPECIES: monovalent cation/H+ antiporter complex subunit F [unclassified Wenzhouxiangella]RFF28397.1 pH regulation protein F [Wenzhouxiangella sp. 15181]RFP69914.1 pH regulation protein F [Wenzhouxiangella sp. 15190]
MNTVLLITILAVFLTMALSLVRAFRGPTNYDRILAVNVFGTKTVLGVALIVFITGHDDLIDVALVYALINFITVVAVLKLVKMRDLATSGEGDITDG